MLEIEKLFLVGLGGSVGAMLRYFIARLFVVLGAAGMFPFHTLFVNLVGCFLIGLLSSIFPSVENNQLTRLFLLTGILGGFTTFSAFGMETVDLIRTGETLSALSYVTSSLVIGLLAVSAGCHLGEYFK